MITTVCKAEPTGSVDVPGEQLAITAQLPRFDSLDEAEAFYQAQAKLIADALGRLPQGTRYQLLILMLQRAQVFYRGA